MLFSFIKEYRQWKKEHREEVQEAKLRKEALKTPLNYQILDKMFQIWTKGQQNAVMEIKLSDAIIKCYWDNGTYRRVTRTEQIMQQ